MSKGKCLYITTPVFYPSDRPHLGHAFTVVFADCLKRYFSVLDYNCYLSVGTDEHGEKILLSAQDAGKDVSKFIDENVAQFKALWTALGIKYDRFVRTSDYAHKSLVKKIFTQFEDTNQIFFDDWKAWYCTACEETYSDRSIEKSTTCKLGHPLILHNEKSFFLRVSSFKTWLKKEYEENEHLIIPSHYKKELINNFINDLDDLSISREGLEWGIKVPDKNNHVIYVWFDALINYLTALNYGNYGNTNTDIFENFWKSSDAKVVHIIGKEISRFHGIYWPIMLKNLDLRLFDTLLIHGWLLMNDEKMSKSKKNVIDPKDILDNIPRDGLRFYLSRLNWTHDSNVSLEDVFSIYNAYLANTYGNLVSRFYGVLSKKFDLKIPDTWRIEEFIEIEQLNIELDNFINSEYEEYVLNYNIFSIVERMFHLFKTTGKIIEKNRIWELESHNPLLRTLMVFIYKLLCTGTWVLSPILIDGSVKVFSALNIPVKKLNLEFFKQQNWFFSKQLNNLEETLYPRLKIES